MPKIDHPFCMQEKLNRTANQRQLKIEMIKFQYPFIFILLNLNALNYSSPLKEISDHLTTR